MEPIAEEDIIYKYVGGVVYRNKQNQKHLFVGKVTRRFLHEKDSAAATLEWNAYRRNMELMITSWKLYHTRVFALHNSDTKNLWKDGISRRL